MRGHLLINSSSHHSLHGGWYTTASSAYQGESSARRVPKQTIQQKSSGKAIPFEFGPGQQGQSDKASCSTQHIAGETASSVPLRLVTAITTATPVVIA